MGLCLANPPVGAQSTGDTDSESKTRAPSADETGLSMEFLEFLGTWESSDGEWVDPAEIQSEDWPVGGDETSDTGAGDAN